MKRKRRLFTGVVPIGRRPIKSRRVAREVTSAFHQLTREMHQVQQRDDIPECDKRTQLTEINSQISELGGRQRYQEASVTSTRYHKVSLKLLLFPSNNYIFQTSKWILENIKTIWPDSPRERPKLKLLEVGAINTQLKSCSWLDVRAIDLHSQVGFRKIICCTF